MAREFGSDDEIAVWADSLDERWPERLEVRRHIVAQVATTRCSQPLLVELCTGDGRLASEVMAAVPDAEYLGFDASRSLGEYVARQEGHKVCPADLSDDAWAGTIESPVDVIFTLQSLHDVGGPEAIANIYQLCNRSLSPGGVLIVSDFAPDAAAYDPEKAGRLPAIWHLEALGKAGFVDSAHTLQRGLLGCFRARKPA